ncbi:helix-turn-helix transcriptional regulator [Natribaculum luteum]|uniref:Helix-turn-helix transcriptional regulator n=1 Tax=Natribaculum luteum TaxID=1586232 RepID=A0ABD5P4W4_9EURY|nr:transcriptional regulator [Natribaculum luteum]
MPASPDDSVLETITRRRSLLAALEDGPRDKRDIVDALECSRSTIDRAIRELEWLAFVDRTDGAYRLTVAGQLALAEHRRRLESIDAIARVADLLEYVPHDAPMAPSMLEGATVHEREPHAPNEPLEEIASLIGTADRLRGFAAADRIPQFRHQLYDRTLDGTLDAEVLFTDELTTFLLEDRPREIRKLLVDGTLDIYSIQSIPYGLGIVETQSSSQAFVVVQNEAAEVQGVIQNDSPAALEWADAVYRRHRATATKLDPPA